MGAQFAAARTFSNAEINNAAGLTLTGPVLVNGILGLTTGIVTSTSANLLTLESTASYTGGNSNTSYISGPIRKIGNTDFIFPVGKTGIGYIPIGISTFTGTLDPLTDAFTAEYFRVNPRPLGPVTAPFIDHISQCDFWRLDRSVGLPVVNVTGYWNANNLSCGPYIDDINAVELASFDGTNWSTSSIGVSVVNGGVGAGDITWTAGVTAFGPITFSQQ
ncbi:MAG: hypothetical protein IPL50_20130 [Chitinophagaceae bacterium]|nr:hypothetical protein [Chitinophagaceae bacterium]